jgi:hypothetical protein
MAYLTKNVTRQFLVALNIHCTHPEGDADIGKGNDQVTTRKKNYTLRLSRHFESPLTSQPMLNRSRDGQLGPPSPV